MEPEAKFTAIRLVLQAMGLSIALCVQPQRQLRALAPSVTVPVRIWTRRPQDDGGDSAVYRHLFPVVRSSA